MRGLLPLLLLLGLALATTWYLQRVETQLATSRPTEQPAINAEGWDVDILVIDALGQPSYRLLSPHAVEATEGGGTDLEQPVLTVYEQDRVPADSRADHGWLSSDLSLLRLEGNVNLVRAPATDGPTTTLDTPWLLVYPQLNRAETEAAVVITAPGQRLEGVGMRADLQREHYQLLSQVRGQHEVTTR